MDSTATHSHPGNSSSPNDATTRPVTWGMLAYGAVFVVGVPALLAAWALGTESAVTLPAIRSIPLGTSLIVAGLTSMAAGALALYVFGHGLPMNAYPPSRFVERGAYALLPHPMYVGFCAVVLGVSLVTGSASGLWLVTPLTALACAALVVGYERHDLERRFGLPHARSALHLPADSAERPSASDRVSTSILALLPWFAVSVALARLGTPHDAISTLLAGEAHWPVLPWTEIIHATALPALLVAILAAPAQAILRRLALHGLYATALGFSLRLTFPLVAPPRASVAPSLLGDLVALQRSLGEGAFPSLHVAWAAIAATALAATWPRAKGIAWAWAAGVTASCLTTGSDSLIDALGGAAVALATLRARAIWDALRRGAERVANSWKNWQLGPVRIINHGAYAAAGTALAAMIAGSLAGPGSTPAVVVTTLSAMICSAIWAQLIEGSPALLRPYGYYGGVIGIILGSFLSPLIGTPTWLMLAAFSVAGPWVQSIGRLRCLVQGCCHGAPAPPSIGIRYTHAQSRVCRLAHLDGVPLHPTPLYSILWNVVIAMVMGRLWSVHAPLHFIGGLYLVLTGLGRFVEEAYRGEPQTKIWAGLRLYQWIAIASVLGGVLVTIFGGGGAAPTPETTWPPILAGVIVGIIAGTALGMDFPASERRFSRLA